MVWVMKARRTSNISSQRPDIVPLFDLSIPVDCDMVDRLVFNFSVMEKIDQGPKSITLTRGPVVVYATPLPSGDVLMSDVIKSTRWAYVRSHAPDDVAEGAIKLLLVHFKHCNYQEEILKLFKKLVVHNTRSAFTRSNIIHSLVEYQGVSVEIMPPDFPRGQKIVVPEVNDGDASRLPESEEAPFIRLRRRRRDS